ncbi:hypothetical protein [Tetragenococcus solitarius]|uniref:DUF2500 family protein n=1 Tax=Tetragenococcus solitarius TaxID=71453 RepID=A0ABP6KT98_9ENTE|nr:hypothetical protein [Tetragenococcus solitarius]
MGYLVVTLTVGLLLLFIYKKIQRFLLKANKQIIRGYYLLVTKKKAEDLGKFYGIFQQGEKEIILELDFSLYLRLQVPQRGYLHAEEGKVLSFKTKE